MIDGKVDEVKYRESEIFIENDDEFVFIEDVDVKAIINSYQKNLKDISVDSIKVRVLENAINMHASVKKSEVFYDVNGVLYAHVWQRVPVVRIFNKSGDGYYIDEDGTVMPLSSKYNARVLIANGNIDAQYVKRLDVSQKDSMRDDRKVLHDLFIIASYIKNDKLWNKLFEQVYVNDVNEFILIPKVGPKEIELGTIDDFEYKMSKLKVFYENSMTKKGFGLYDRISLKFSNQIVAHKIESENE